ncbi:type I-E CRISPR-associated protein Cse1/CasA [Nocardia sp. 2YAB30]|uniref:type I-E CRISPR-associated protein Cse1/CasA n=1 Tax=unclassified Nocardia TaxID=2637762 RepID=UPI003F9E8CB1
MDLRSEQWISVHTSEGPATVGFRDLFVNAHDIVGLDVGLAPAAAGLLRVLTVIAARVSGLDDPGADVDDWLERRDEVLESARFDPDAVDGYFFDDYRDRFHLFHPERPWLQDPRLAQQCSAGSGLNKLILGRPAGNNQPWVSHHHDRLAAPVASGEAVLHLIASLYYGAPGRCTSRTVDGRSEANSTAGPLRGLMSYHPLGKNMFESLVAAIPYVPRRDPSGDRAAWERDELPNPVSIPPESNGVGAGLADRFRHAALLTPSADARTVTDAYLTWAWRQPHPPVKDPFNIHQISKAGEIYARPANADRSLWRDLDALLLHDVGIEHRRRPEVLDLAERLPPELLTRLRIEAFGFDQDRTQVNDRQWFAAATPPMEDLLVDHAAAMAVSRAREAAERTHRHLDRALRNAWIAINDPSNGNGRPTRKESDIGAGPWIAHAASRYWPAAEGEFWRQVSCRDFDDSARRFISLALAAYDRVTDQAGRRPRTRRAIERARGYIYRAADAPPTNS